MKKRNTIIRYLARSYADRHLCVLCIDIQTGEYRRIR